MQRLITKTAAMKVALAVLTVASILSLGGASSSGDTKTAGLTGVKPEHVPFSFSDEEKKLLSQDAKALANNAERVSH